MIRVAVLDDYQRVARKMADWDSLGADCKVDFFHENLPVETAGEVLKPYDVLCLMRERLPMPRDLIERLDNLKLVIFTGAKLRTIDMEAVAERGVTVCHTHAGETLDATAELAWGLIISRMRHLAEEHHRMREGGWQQTIGATLHGKTLGVVGLGRLGGRMVPVARAFGMHVIAWSQNLTPERAAEAGAALVSKSELFARSDVVTIHLVLGERTRGLVGERELAQMKPTAILVNTSRGPIVDEAALIAALKARRIAGAGLDVFDVEPLPADHPLRRLDNVTLTPHLGYVTEGSYRPFYRDMVEGIAAWRAGNPVRVVASGD
jgi:phosphoglycerate dehydrogenase-like enzyme